MTPLYTITEFLIDHLQCEHKEALAPMLADVAAACKEIAVAIEAGALNGNMGSLDSENVQGEVQKALDMITHDIFIATNQQSGYVAAMASEEVAEIIEVPLNYRQNGDYLLVFDPLDGSSNVNVNISVGTIFSILKSASKQPTLADFLQAGTAQVCAGYALYGTSTMLVFTTGKGVNGFTLDAKVGEFYLTHPNMQITPDTQEFSINMSNLI